LAQPAARSFFVAFTVLPLTFGTMQLETMVALKPSSRLPLVLEPLGALSPARMGNLAAKVTIPGPGVPLCVEPVLTNPPQMGEGPEASSHLMR
jgi:hypothetical protein